MEIVAGDDVFHADLRLPPHAHGLRARQRQQPRQHAKQETMRQMHAHVELAAMPYRILGRTACAFGPSPAGY